MYEAQVATDLAKNMRRKYGPGVVGALAGGIVGVTKAVKKRNAAKAVIKAPKPLYRKALTALGFADHKELEARKVLKGFKKDLAIKGAVGITTGVTVGHVGSTMGRKAIGRVVTNIKMPKEYEVGSLEKYKLKDKLIAIRDDHPVYYKDITKNKGVGIDATAMAAREILYREAFGLKPREKLIKHLNSEMVKNEKGVYEFRGRLAKKVKTKPYHPVMAGFGKHVDPKTGITEYFDNWDFALNPGEKLNLNFRDKSNNLNWLRYFADKVTLPPVQHGYVV